MWKSPLGAALRIAVIVSTAGLYGCGEDQPSSAAAVPPIATTSDVELAATLPGQTPFVAFMQLRGQDLRNATALSYQIASRPGSVSRPVNVKYSIASLRQRGYAVDGTGSATVPIVGLYSGFSNHVSLRIDYVDASHQGFERDIATPAYVDGIYDQPNILVARPDTGSLGFDFFAMKSRTGSPVVVDTDGYVRWAGAAIANALSSTFDDAGFFVGDQATPTLRRVELDGSISAKPLIAASYIAFHHNIDRGKVGLLVEMDTQTPAGVTNLESVLAEVSTSGVVLREWDFGAILETYMSAHGDDPSLFVRPGVDWFHMNGTAYDASDNSLVVSSREDFLIKIDYDTSEIKWIFGDPTKYWYTFPSLRNKAVLLNGGGLYPIGQHAPSITSDGSLMIFNDGLGSLNQPIGAPPGETRTYSTVSAYSIDETNLVATEAWQFDYDQTIYSRICSSAYEAPDQSVLVSYSMASDGAKARLVGLNTAREVVFDVEYNNTSGIACSTSWNAIPIPLDNLIYN